MVNNETKTILVWDLFLIMADLHYVQEARFGQKRVCPNNGRQRIDAEIDINQHIVIRIHPQMHTDGNLMIKVEPIIYCRIVIIDDKCCSFSR